MYKGMDISMILGTDDVTFIRFGNPAHFLKEAISRSDTIKDRTETDAINDVSARKHSRKFLLAKNAENAKMN